MLDKNKHRQIMYNILKDIFNSDIAKYLAFKGGTAAYFLYWLDRFSTDLDFDLLTDIKVDDKFIQLISTYGIVKKKSKIVLSYKSGEDSLKLDINRKIRKNNKYEKISFFGTDMQVQSKSTIFTNKLVALLERNTNRDIYDVYFFFKNNFDLNEKLILERLEITKKELFEKILKKLKVFWPHYKILDWLWEVLDQKQKNWVKHNLLQELVGIIEMNLFLS